MTLGLPQREKIKTKNKRINKKGLFCLNSYYDKISSRVASKQTC